MIVRANTSDKHHCRCFVIKRRDVPICRKHLEEMGFERQPIGEENHGQEFGLRYRIERVLQIHVKVMANGLIESELEPPPEYPIAHLNQRYSYSPHLGLPLLLSQIGLEYKIRTPIPDTCNLPEIIKPGRPLSAWETVLALLGIIVVCYLLYQGLKK